MIDEDIHKTTAFRLRKIRKALGMTQAAFARNLEISKPTYVRYESGEMLPNLHTLYLLRTSFNVCLDWFLQGEGEMFVSTALPYSRGTKGKASTDSLYLELLELMEVPEVERAVLSKLDEVKRIFKEDIAAQREKRVGHQGTKT